MVANVEGNPRLGRPLTPVDDAHVKKNQRSDRAIKTEHGSNCSKVYSSLVTEQQKENRVDNYWLFPERMRTNHNAKDHNGRLKLGL
ncbi:hypothetical protein Trydic_g15045 [Trypoxylus dichotomus]